MAAAPTTTAEWAPRLVPWRGRAAVAMLLAAGLLTALGVHYAHTSAPGRVDSLVAGPLWAVFRAHPRAVIDVADLGGPTALAVATGWVTAAALLLRRPRGALLAVAAAPVADVITEEMLKPWVHRSLDGASAFPSGHATGIFSIAVAAAVIVRDPAGRRLPRAVQRVLAAAAVAVAVLVAAALVAADFHYATDTAGGACVAVLTVLGLGLGIDALADRRAASHPRRLTTGTGTAGKVTPR